MRDNVNATTRRSNFLIYMGKKSSSKKKKIQEKQASSQESKSAKRRWLKEWSREKWLATGLVVAALMMLSWAAVVSWIHLMQPKQISLLVPKDTIAIMEIDTDFSGAQWEKYNALTSSTNAPSGIPGVADLLSSVNSVLNINVANDIYPWLARRASVALLADFKPALFLEVKDKNQALTYFQNRRLEGTAEQFQQKEYRGTTLYQYVASTPFSIFSLSSYLVIASDEASAKRIIDASHDKSETLYAQYAYQHVYNAFAGERLAFAYGKPEYLNLFAASGTSFTTLPSIPSSSPSQPSSLSLASQSLLSSSLPQSSSSSSPSASSLQQLTSMLEHAFSNILAGEGMSVKALDDKLMIEHLALFNDATRATKTFLKLPQKYQARLTEFFSPETEFFAGGENMPLVMQKFATLLATKEMSQQAIETNIKTQVTEFFGGKLTTQEFESLTQNEYAIGLDHGAIKIVVALTGSEQENDRLLKKLMYALEWKTINTQLASRIIGNVGLITSSQESLEDAVQLWSRPEKQSLKTSHIYQQMIEPQMHSADDIIFAKPSSMTSIIPDSLSFLKGIAALSMASTAFEDGMKTTLFIAPFISPNTSANGS